MDVYVNLAEHRKEIIEYVAAHCYPEEVFPERELAEWAKENDFTKEKETE